VHRPIARVGMVGSTHLLTCKDLVTELCSLPTRAPTLAQVNTSSENGVNTLQSTDGEAVRGRVTWSRQRRTESFSIVFLELVDPREPGQVEDEPHGSEPWPHRAKRSRRSRLKRNAPDWIRTNDLRFRRPRLI